MTESEWQTSEEPVAMLGWLTRCHFDAGVLSHPGTSWRDRKLRLLACAISRRRPAFSSDVVEMVEAYAEDPGRWQPQFLEAQQRGYWYASEDPYHAAETLAQSTAGVKHGAGLLREIVGNPFRPVMLPPAEYLHHDGSEIRSTPILSRHRYATPTVLSIAHAAYDERPGRKCGQCKGEGSIPAYVGMYRLGSDPCKSCRGLGTIEDGSLDPVNLAVLSDALEEAGCTDEAILRHLRGEEPCPACMDGPLDHQGELAPDCWGTGWIPLRCPHVRGCWALDLILGKE